MAQTNLPAEGRVGVEPPPNAPREVSQPLTAEARTIPADKRGNEQELAPLTYGRQPQGTVTSGVVEEATGEVKEPEAVKAAPGYKIPEARSTQPAASNSDSPSRGRPGTTPVPRERTTPPLSVTGGWGQGEAEYFPLNGAELKTLIEQLMDEVHARIQNDLRFSVALTYPRLTAKVQIVVEGEAEDSGFQIDRVLPENGRWNRTPVSVAQQHGDSVVFVVTAERKEFSTSEVDAEGNPVSETPVDAMREELGLPVPRKTVIGTGAMQQFSDVNW